MKSINIILLILATVCCASEQPERTWTSTVGSTIQAALISSDGHKVLLQRSDGSQLSVGLNQLSSSDQSYVANLPEPKGNTHINGISAEPGSISSAIKCANDSKWSYHLYLPKDFHDGHTWPVWFIMSPGGGIGGSAMQRYINGAEMLGCILALSVESKNNFDDSELAMEAMVKDVHARVPVEKELSFASGFSGGSRMAYLLAERNRNIQGVLACGSGSGVYQKNEAFRDAKLRRSTYIYSLIGTNCFNRTGAFNSHVSFSDSCRLRYFPGNHDWAPSSYIAEGMARVLGEALKYKKTAKLARIQSQYATAMWTMTQSMQIDTPWEAHYWASFLADFPNSRSQQNEAHSLARKLATNEKVKAAIKAEAAINKFGKKYFLDVHYKADQKPNDSRKKDADRIAQDFLTIPHGTLIQRLGQKS